jgi:hypothetical protein
MEKLKYLMLIFTLTSCTTSKPLVIWNDGFMVYKDFCYVKSHNCGATVYNCDLFQGITYCSNNVTIYDKTVYDKINK